VASAAAESGAPAPVQLPAPASVGQAVRTEASIQTIIDGGPVSLYLATSSAVIAVAGDGSYTAESTIESVDVTNAPASADVMSWGFDTLEGSTFERTYARTGAPLTLATRSVNAQSLVLDAVSMASIGFPTDPVVVGDSWTVGGVIANDGMSFTVTYQCRLASVVDGTFAVDVSYAEGFSTPVEGGVAEGTISGTGTLNGSLANPLVVSGGLNQTIDGVVTVGDTATMLRRDTSITLTSGG
jgi:hypothetical protein